MPIVTLNGWPGLMVDGGPRRKHKVLPRTGCPGHGIDGCIVGPSGGPIIETFKFPESTDFASSIVAD